MYIHSEVKTQGSLVLSGTQLCLIRAPSSVKDYIYIYKDYIHIYIYGVWLLRNDKEVISNIHGHTEIYTYTLTCTHE